ncbi:MAG: endonuclease/exonuclease/phosphatase family protein, partial [Marinirhabdus sp.]
MKKKRGCFTTLFYWANILLALLLLVTFVVPYVPPSKFPLLSLLGLTVHPLLFLHFLFFVYWVFSKNRRSLLSLVMLLLAYFMFNPFYHFGSKSSYGFQHSLKVLSYNVRLFNAYEEKENNTTVRDFRDLVRTQNPDVVLVQEYDREAPQVLAGYPFKYIHYPRENSRVGQAIFSKYKLMGTGSLNFKNTYNNTVYANVIKNRDTLRVYNVHLQSMGILLDVDYLRSQGKEKLARRIANAFVKQERQIEKIMDHRLQSPHPVILGGDFNNTATSYSYKKLSGGMRDSFLERGSGLGTTFYIFGYPMRIDYL